MMGSVWGIARVKDEADVIASTTRWMLTQVDYVMVQDNASTDGTRDVLEGLKHAGDGRLLICEDSEVGYYQSAKMSSLAWDAQAMGASWVIPFDADEVWTAPGGHTLRDWLVNLDPRISIAQAQLFDHVATSADDAGETDPVKRIQWRRRKPAELPKVAARTQPSLVIHQGNHGADYGHQADAGLVVHHYPYRSVEQLIRKVRNGAAAYAATDLPEDVGKHWRDYGRLTDEQLRELFQTWHYCATTAGLDHDPAPLP